jgi:hypothetical protein
MNVKNMLGINCMARATFANHRAYISLGEMYTNVLDGIDNGLQCRYVDNNSGVPFSALALSRA